MYEIETEKLDLGEDQYAVLYKELKHGTSVAVQEIARGHMHFADGSSEMKYTQGEELKMPEGKEVIVDINQLDFNATNKAIVLRQVKVWSFGDKVDEVTYNDIPERFVEKIVERCNELYKSPLAGSGGVS